MKRTLSLCLMLILLLGISVPCYAVGDVQDSQDAYVKYNREEQKYTVPLENGAAQMLTDSGYTVSVSDAPTEAVSLRVVSIPKEETAAWDWFAGCIGNDAPIAAVFDISFVDSAGNRIPANYVGLALESVYEQSTVFGVSTDGTTQEIGSKQAGSILFFTADGSYYYVLAGMNSFTSLEIITQPESVHAMIGDDAVFTVMAIGEELTYQWQSRSGEGKAWSNVNSRTDTLTVAAAANRNGYQYRCVIVDAEGNEVSSQVVSLWVSGIQYQPEDQYVLKDEDASFSVTATGEGLRYQWQYRQNEEESWKATTASGNKTNTITVTGTLSRDGYQYRCVITDASGNQMTTDAATLHITGIQSNPEDQIVLMGEEAAFAVNASGSELAYQWQYRKHGNDTWKMTTLEGNKTAALTVAGTASRNGYQYRCKISDGEGNVLYTDAATMYVTGIVNQPISRGAQVGESVSFTLDAIGKDLSYQWQYRTGEDKAWASTTVSGNKTNTLTVSATLERNGYQYRCRITDGAGNVIYSDAAILYITGIKNHPEDRIILKDEEATFSVVATGEDLTYQWQYRKHDNDTWRTTTVSGNKTDTITVSGTIPRDGYQYRCRVTDGEGNVIYSEAAILRVTAIKTHPNSYSGGAGESAVFQVVATGDGLKYQWQYCNGDNDTWKSTTLSGYKTAALTVPVTASRNGYQYRCKITDSAGNVIYSDAAVLSLGGLEIVEQPESMDLTLGQTGAFHVEVNGTGLKYQWQYRTSATGTWYTTTVTGNKTATLTVTATAARNGYQYRCVVTDADGNQVISDAVTLTVRQGDLSIDTQPVSVNAQLGDSVSFTVRASGSGLTYQWQYRTSATGTWYTTTVTGNKTATLTVTATAARNGYQYRCVITDANGSQVISNGATLRISQESGEDLVIENQPVSVTAKLNETAHFTVKASGTGLKYQWQWRSSDRGTWAATTVTGNKTATLTVTATAARNGYQYRCVITDGSGNEIISDGATLTVK